MKKIILLLICLVLCILTIAIPCSAAEVSTDNPSITPLGIYRDYYIPMGYYSFPRFENLDTSLVTDTHRIRGQISATIKVRFPDGYILGVFRFDQITISNYNTLTVSLDSNVQSETPFISGNLTVEDLYEAYDLLDDFMLDSEFNIYQHGIGYLFDNRISIESIKVLTPIFCDSLWNHIFDFENLMVSPLSPKFIDIGSYILDERIFAYGGFSNDVIEFPFYSNNNSYNSIRLTDSFIYYDDTLVYDSSGWLNKNYKLLTYVSSLPFIMPTSEFYYSFQDLLEYSPLYSYLLQNGYTQEELNNYYNQAEQLGYNRGYEQALEDGLTTNIFGNIVNTLDSLRLFDTISVLDIIFTLIGLFVFVFVLKLIAGG